MCQAANPLNCVVDQCFPTVLNREQKALCSCHRTGELQAPRLVKSEQPCFDFVLCGRLFKYNLVSIWVRITWLKKRSTQIKNAADSVKSVSFKQHNNKINDGCHSLGRTQGCTVINSRDSRSVFYLVFLSDLGRETFFLKPQFLHL